MSEIEIDVNDPLIRAIGIILAVMSGVLIGMSFILKKKGLISSRVEGEEDGHAYLKSAMWWSGMILMALGEVTNFVAYILAPAVLVTPLGALSVVVSAVMSSIFLKERLNFHGKIGCIICLLGSVIVVLHAPEQSAPGYIDQFMKLAIAPGFLTYTIVILIASVILAYKVAPKYGKKHPLIYISICSFTGSLSVVTLQAVGGAIITTIKGANQFTHWFIYLLIVFIALTIITQINFLNKALNEFVTAEITPMYYVIFTTATIISSAILYQGFNASPISIVTLLLAFLCICGGVIILQTSRMYESLASEEEEGSIKEKVVKDDESRIEVNQESREPTIVNQRIITGDAEDPSAHTSYTINVQDNFDSNASIRSSIRGGTPIPKTSVLPPHVQRSIRPQASRTSTMTQDSNRSLLVKFGNLMHPEKDDHLKRRTLFTDEQLEASSLNHKPSLNKLNNDCLPGVSPGSFLLSADAPNGEDSPIPEPEPTSSVSDSPNSFVKKLMRTVSNPTIRTRARSKSSPTRPMSQVTNSPSPLTLGKYTPATNIIVINEESESANHSPTDKAPAKNSC